jgi:hypothetical protein
MAGLTDNLTSVRDLAKTRIDAPVSPISFSVLPRSSTLSSPSRASEVTYRHARRCHSTRLRTAVLEAVTLVCRATIAAPIYKATFAAAAPSICTFSMFVWSNFVPPRARFFAWLLAQQRIHCKSDSKTCALNNVVFSF